MRCADLERPGRIADRDVGGERSRRCMHRGAEQDRSERRSQRMPLRSDRISSASHVVLPFEHHHAGVHSARPNRNCTARVATCACLFAAHAGYHEAYRSHEHDRESMLKTPSRGVCVPPCDALRRGLLAVRIIGLRRLRRHRGRQTPAPARGWRGQRSRESVERLRSRRETVRGAHRLTVCGQGRADGAGDRDCLRRPSTHSICHHMTVT